MRLALPFLVFVSVAIMLAPASAQTVDQPFAVELALSAHR